MIITQPNRLIGQFINIGRLDDRISRTAQISVALVICDDQNDVGLFSSHKELSNEKNGQKEEVFFHNGSGFEIRALNKAHSRRNPR